jgi:anti-sigma B factor antagonist
MNSSQFFQASIVDDDILCVVLRGNLDSTTTEEFNNEIHRHLEQGRSKIIIDCRSVGFVSSVGIGSLVALQTRLRKRGGVVKLAAVQGMTAEIIKMIGLDRLLEIYGDCEFARQSFKK